MNLKIPLLPLLVLSSTFVGGVFAQLNIPGADGSDGPLIVSSNQAIDLSAAVPGAWDANNSGNQGKGIYDSNKWAVVFKYSSVSVSNGATLTFTNHPTHAPVVWLVNGDVTIGSAAIVSLDGWAAVGGDGPHLAEPGPGGFRGGAGPAPNGLVGSSAGYGPGGGAILGLAGGGGSYGSSGAGVAKLTYGNPSLLPLIGGSGGAGGWGGGGNPTGGGGGGGGAILIACSGTLSVLGTGALRANGGKDAGGAGGGSGGAIRLVAASLGGTGAVQCFGGSGGNFGGSGLIRIERITDGGNLQVYPGPSVISLNAGDSAQIWLPSDGPSAKIIFIGGVSAPDDPRASFGTYGADVSLPQVPSVPVLVATTNVEPSSTVTVRVTPRASGNYAEIKAALTQTNSLSPLVLIWTANVQVTNGLFAVQAKVVRPGP